MGRARVIDVSLDGAALELPENVYAAKSPHLLGASLGRETSAGVALRADVRSLVSRRMDITRRGDVRERHLLEHQFLVDDDQALG